MNKVGIIRGPNLNPYEGQCFEKLKMYNFMPVGITTHDSIFNLSEINFPVRIGYSLKTLTKDVFRPLLGAAEKVTRYDFGAYNSQIMSLKKLTEDLDILNSADIWYPFTYQAIRTKIPTVVTEWENIPFVVEKQPYAKIKKYNREHAAHFIAITKKAKKALVVEGVSPSRISLLPAGLDCEKFKPAERDEQMIKKFGIPGDTFNILFVGRIVPEKGIFTLLDAFSMLCKNFRDVQLLIVGLGPSKIIAQINSIILNSKVESKVKFLGGIPYLLMPKIHNSADVFCLPSIATKRWQEQFGFSLVEAMACGKPVVSTYTGSIPEVVKDRETGILVDQNQPYALKEALEELILNEKERKTLGKNGRLWVLQQFEANKIAKQLAGIYEHFI